MSVLWYALALLIVVGLARFSVSLFALLVVGVAVYEVITHNRAAVSTGVNSATESVTSTTTSMSGFLSERAATIHVSELTSVIIILGIGVLVVLYTLLAKQRRKRLN